MRYKIQFPHGVADCHRLGVVKAIRAMIGGEIKPVIELVKEMDANPHREYVILPDPAFCNDFADHRGALEMWGAVVKADSTPAFTPGPVTVVSLLWQALDLAVAGRDAATVAALSDLIGRL